MEYNADVEQFATDIYDEVKETGKVQFNMVVDNVDLQELDVTIQMSVVTDSRDKAQKNRFHTSYHVMSRKLYYSADCGNETQYGIVGFGEKDLRHLNMFSFDDTTKEDAVEKIIQNIMHLDDLFENVFLDRLAGCFVNRKNESEMRKYRMRTTKSKVFKHRKQVTDNVCCVCGDETNTTTICKHHLCVGCWNKLDKLTCPCCRSCVKYTEPEEEED
jgi:hypothetical protein